MVRSRVTGRCDSDRDRLAGRLRGSSATVNVPGAALLGPVSDVGIGH